MSAPVTPQVVARMVAKSRAAQGLPPRVVDAAALRNVAVLLSPVAGTRARRRKA